MSNKEHTNVGGNNAVTVTHTHYKLSFSGAIMSWLFMPRPPLEEGGCERPPRLDVGTAVMILGVFMVIALIAFYAYTSSSHESRLREVVNHMPKSALLVS